MRSGMLGIPGRGLAAGGGKGGGGPAIGGGGGGGGIGGCAIGCAVVGACIIPVAAPVHPTPAAGLPPPRAPQLQPTGTPWRLLSKPKRPSCPTLRCKEFLFCKNAEDAAPVQKRHANQHPRMLVAENRAMEEAFVESPTAHNLRF